MVFVAIHLAFLVFGVTGFGVFLTFAEVRLAFLRPCIGAAFRLSFVRVWLLLRNEVRRGNSEVVRGKFTDDPQTQTRYQCRSQDESDRRRFIDILPPAAENQSHLETARLDNGTPILLLAHVHPLLSALRIGGRAIPWYRVNSVFDGGDLL